MDSNDIRKNPIHLVNSDERILQVLEQTNEYFRMNKELSFKINEYLEIFRSLGDLSSALPENLLLGYRFPLIEAESEFENSIVLCKLGFYKHAFIALRSVLELGILSAYWNVDENNHLDIRKWLVSLENTPKRKTVFTKLKTNQNFQEFDDKHRFFDEITETFNQLSNFVHTKGHQHSNMDLGNSNVNRFNEKSLLKWLKIMTGVTKLVLILHILKSPVALQHTPIEQKFGINGPAGGFLEPYQADRIRRFLDKDVMSTLQEISDKDSEAASLAEGINELPDITEEEFHAQMGEF